MIVLQFPPKESFNNLVNLLPRNGINGFFMFYSLASARDWMQLPKTSKLWFIFAPSNILRPRLDVAAALSEPARSTSVNYEICISALIPSALSLISTCTCKIACDLDEA